MNVLTHSVLNPIQHPVLDIFLLGFIGSCSLCAAIFFLRFWRDTRDRLFLAFAAFFAIQGMLDIFALELGHPNEGTVTLFVLRLLSVLLVLGAILRKNMGKG
ncbi:MAG TPA: DUF5985 family protein [Acidobacteriaceae bacterium]